MLNKRQHYYLTVRIIRISRYVQCHNYIFSEKRIVLRDGRFVTHNDEVIAAVISSSNIATTLSP